MFSSIIKRRTKNSTYKTEWHLNTSMLSFDQERESNVVPIQRSIAAKYLCCGGVSVSPLILFKFHHLRMIGDTQTGQYQAFLIISIQVKFGQSVRSVVREL